MASFWAQRVGDTLVPHGTESHVEFARVPFNKLVHVEVRRPRNSQHHRLYWALCARIAGAIGSDAENISDMFKIATGHCTIIRSKTYGELKLPKSIAFSRMDQTQFSAFFERCIQVMYEEWRIDPAIAADLLVPQEANQKDAAHAA